MTDQQPDAVRHADALMTPGADIDCEAIAYTLLRQQEEITRLTAALDDAQAEASVARVAVEALRAALRRTILMYAVDDDAWDREAAADRAVQAAIDAARKAQE
jgi:TfoX/Sxy family transcriptional regulator of competence genes